MFTHAHEMIGPSPTLISMVIWVGLIVKGASRDACRLFGRKISFIEVDIYYGQMLST